MPTSRLPTIGRSERLDPKVRALHVTATAIHELGYGLSRDPFFRQQIAAILAGEQSTAGLATLYCPDSPPPRAAIEQIVSVAVARHRWLSNPDVSHDAKSLKEDRLPTERELWLRVEHALMNAALRFCWADAPLDPGEPQRSLREGARMLISEGVELIKRRGAGLCLECGRPVSGGDRSRAARIVYCAPCSGSLDDSRKRRHRDVLSATLGRIAEAMGTSDRTARRRVRRAGQ